MAHPPAPDPNHGVFETLLVCDGRPVELEAHLSRLEASLRALFGAGLPAPARGLASERAAGLRLGRLRLTVAPNGAGLTCEVAAAALDPALPFPAWERGAELRGTPLAGGLGAHKWADRAAVDAVTDDAVPLLLDGEEVLEAGWANVFAVSEGALQTPLADGRILPGIAREGAIAVAREAGIEVRERRLRRADLLAADEVFLTGSLRGVEPAHSLDGICLAASGEVSRLLAAGLRRRWRLPPDAAAAPAPAGAPRHDRPAR
jgi:para-aminobenzoate synthetase / 4-amino-4-deoxychorismate lyase